MFQRNLNSLRVLCVEDDELTRLSIVNIIRRRAAEIFTASDGEEGLDIFLKQKPDLVIADLDMPIMSGAEMISEIRKHDTEVPIIVVTAFSDQGRNVSGADYVMVKPVHKDLLLDIIGSCIKRLNSTGDV